MAQTMSMSVSTWNAPCAPTQSCTTGLERARFFPRQLIGPDDLTVDQIYFREKARRHNRMIHGWGVVCGARVKAGKTPCEVIIETGYALGPFGDEIIIDREVSIDVCKLGASEQAGCCGDALDPWCGDGGGTCPDGTLYLAVRYAECQTRPVRGPGGGCGCGCEDTSCEYTRIRDSFSVKLLHDLPSGYATPMPEPDLKDILVCNGCLPCPKDPWVVLADLSVAKNCNVGKIDCFAHRRNVASLANFYFMCDAEDHK